MLTRIRLKNIQKHKDLTLVLDKINVIVGATDTGKTSVFRGLLWGMTNNESGENLINNDGAKACSVSLNIDGHEIERSWTKSKNAYRLDAKEFTTFRTTVPSPIADLLNITELNVQGRRDLPFMVYYKASECANQFSEMLDLDEIDSTISNSNKSVKQHVEASDRLDNALKEITNELARYVNLDEAMKAFNALSGLRATLLKVDAQLERLNALRAKIVAANKTFEAIDNPFGAIERLKYLEELNRKYAELSDRIRKYSDIERKYTALIDTVGKLHKVDAAIKKFAKFTDTVKEGRKLADRIAVLQDLKQQYKRTKTFLQCTEQNYRDLHEKFVQDFPAVCPLCGGTDHAL